MTITPEIDFPIRRRLAYLKGHNIAQIDRGHAILGAETGLQLNNLADDVHDRLDDLAWQVRQTLDAIRTGR